MKSSEPLSVAPPESAAETGAPFSAVGGATDRDASGRFVPGNRAALVVGETSARFWQAHEQARRELRDGVLADAGYPANDAPRALVIAAESIAQATVIRDSAYARLAEGGGPLASSGRVRRAFVVWSAAVAGLERHLRLVGLDRAPRSVGLVEQIAELHREGDR